jgi:hypothetical protein
MQALHIGNGFQDAGTGGLYDRRPVPIKAAGRLVTG